MTPISATKTPSIPLHKAPMPSPKDMQHPLSDAQISKLKQIPESLPIAAYTQQLIKLIANEQVIIVCGDTGSGKTTQLPKLALLARGQRQGLIGCTQPRRLAAISMAKRVSEELQSPTGDFVGYQHRFERKLSPQTRLKFMTDGILLSETRRDPLFKAYSVLIIDEAHERSLNIDFLLGLIREILPKRPDLRIIISSATLDSAGFSAFFHNATVVNIPGRLFPIERHWMPLEDEEDDDLPRRIANAVDSLNNEDGDILVFLPGERDIRDTKEMLEGRRLPRTEIIPLMASLPAGEQERAFRLSSNRRIILATNVAETSLTLPGIRCVIDSGLARIKRYNAKSHIQQLKIEPVSQASCRQRMGRCGRIGPGICICLYSEEDYLRRDAHTLPEIKRSALAGVILSMYDLRLGSIDNFPFLDPPSGIMIREGYRELIELNAIEKRHDTWQVTRIGRDLMGIPVEPRYARMLFAGEAEQNLHDTLIIVAGLACDDPKQRPVEKQDAADNAHRQFLTNNSDFTAMLNLWKWYRDTSSPQSQTAKRKRCKEFFLSYPKMREWESIRDQLEDICHSKRLHVAERKGGEAALHKALLAGLLTRIGHRDAQTGDYHASYGVRFNIFPGSGLNKKKQPKETKVKPGELPLSREWIIAGELVDTSRLFARRVACVDARWIEPLASHLCKYHRHSPFWDAEKGFVRIYEQVILFGLILVEKRLRDYTHIDPIDARSIFIRQALVEIDHLNHPPHDIATNQKRQYQILQTATHLRQPTAFCEEAFFTFYDTHLPQDISNAPSLKRYLTKHSLLMSDADFPIDKSTQRDYPVEIVINGHTLALSYKHNPEAEDDGVTCIGTPHQICDLHSWHYDWLVPGLLQDKLRWMLNTLPNKTRRLLQPIDETLAILTTHLQPHRRPLNESVFKTLLMQKAIRVPEEQWHEDKVPDHLRMNFRVVDTNGKIINESRNLSHLVSLLGTNTPQPTKENFSLETFTFDFKRPGQTLIVRGGSIEVSECLDPVLAKLSHHKALIELFQLLVGPSFSTLTQLTSLPQRIKSFVNTAEIDIKALGQDIARLGVAETFIDDRPELRNMDDVKIRLRSNRLSLNRIIAQWRQLITAILFLAAGLEQEAQSTTGVFQETLDDILDQLAWLIFDGFTKSVPPEQIKLYPLYLEAIRVRLGRAHTNPGGDTRKASTFQPLWIRYVDFATAIKQSRHDPLLLSEYRWALESLRITTFAPELKPPESYSAKKLDTLWQLVHYLS